MSYEGQQQDVITILNQANETAKREVTILVKDSHEKDQHIKKVEAANLELADEAAFYSAAIIHERNHSDSTLLCMMISWIFVIFLTFFLFAQNATAATFEVSKDGPVTGYFVGQSADYDNVLRVAGIDLLAVNGFHNHRSTFGQSINFGIGHAGTEIVFTDQVINTGDFWFSNQSQNSDGMDHMFYSPFSLPDGTPALLVGFEDLKGLGDNDKNDVMAVFTNVQVMTPVPEPETYMMLIVGLMLVFVSIRGIGTRRLDMNF